MNNKSDLNNNSLSGDYTESEMSIKSEDKSNKNKNLYSDSLNHTEKKSFISKTFKDQIFWSKDKMEEIRNRLKLARQMIIEKTKRDFDEIYSLIDLKISFYLIHIYYLN